MLYDILIALGFMGTGILLGLIIAAVAITDIEKKSDKFPERKKRINVFITNAD